MKRLRPEGHEECDVRIRELEAELKIQTITAENLEWDNQYLRDRFQQENARAEKAERERDAEWKLRAKTEERAVNAEARVAVAEAALKREGLVYCNCDQNGPLWYRPRDEPFKHPFTDCEAREREEC